MLCSLLLCFVKTGLGKMFSASQEMATTTVDENGFGLCNTKSKHNAKTQFFLFPARSSQETRHSRGQ
jgi:hypothetical protein